MTPCYGLGELFFATINELKYPEHSTPHAAAVELCSECPVRQRCAQQGLYHDRHTVRAGLRLWIREERALLRLVAEGEVP